MNKPITILDLAIHRGAKPGDTGGYSGDELERVGLAIFGGCLRCEASIAAYNAHPTKLGFWCCKHCVGDDGFATVEEAEAFMALDLDEGDAG